MFPVHEVEKLLGVSFRDPKLLITAFTHRSTLNDYRDWPTHHNERLEFLGDAVLELIVTEALFQKAPDADEGKLTRWRAAFVRRDTLANCAKKMNLDPHVAMSRGERKDTGRARDVILSNVLEAIIGAIYVDQGFVAARSFVCRVLFRNFDEATLDKMSSDAKSKLQDTIQEKLRITPTYQLIKRDGPDHNVRFTMGVFFGEQMIATGIGVSKQDAEQQAAASALQAKSW